MDTTNLKVKKLVIELDETPAPVNKTNAPVSKTPAPVNKTNAPVTKTPTPVNKTNAPVSEDKIVAPVTQRDENLFWKILAVLALLALIAFAIGSFIRTQAVSPTQGTGSSDSASIASPNNDVWTAVLTSANSNGNFIGDMGGKGNGSIIPAEAVDLQGKTWKVGRALLTYCETSKSCFYMIAKPNDVMPRAFNVNLYTPEFTGDLVKELPYINTGWNNDVDVVWSYWK